MKELIEKLKKRHEDFMKVDEREIEYLMTRDHEFDDLTERQELCLKAMVALI